jgi:hypothetical protein
LYLDAGCTSILHAHPSPSSRQHPGAVCAGRLAGSNCSCDADPRRSYSRSLICDGLGSRAFVIPPSLTSISSAAQQATLGSILQQNLRGYVSLYPYWNHIFYKTEVLFARLIPVHFRRVPALSLINPSSIHKSSHLSEHVVTDQGSAGVIHQSMQKPKIASLACLANLIPVASTQAPPVRCRISYQ